MKEATNRAIRWAQAGLLTNALLVFVKLFAGIIGHSNALIADAVESSADIFSSLIVWMGLSIAARVELAKGQNARRSCKLMIQY